MFVFGLSTFIFCASISASSDHVARLWEMATGETVRHYNGHHKGKWHAVGCMGLMRDSVYLLCTSRLTGNGLGDYVCT